MTTTLHCVRCDGYYPMHEMKEDKDGLYRCKVKCQEAKSE